MFDSGYFGKFPVIPYANHNVKHIFLRSRFFEGIKKNEFNLLPYTVKEGERPDTLAYNYYGNSKLSWMIYLVNEIYDPYFEWPMFGITFDNFIVEKFGSIQEAKNRIKYWRVEWTSDESQLLEGNFDSLPASKKKYWVPFIGFNNRINYYERKKVDWIATTNKTVTITTTSNTDDIALGERVSLASNTQVNGVLTFVSNNSIVLSHVNYTFPLGANLVSNTSKVSITTSSVVNNSIVNTISAEEQEYWQPVTEYQYYQELNDQRKEIRLVDKQYAGALDAILTDLLR